MESLLKPMKLSPEVNRVLEEIRKGAENALYCAEPAAADKLFHEHVESLIEGAGLTSMQVIHYRWFLREVARLWRTRQGRDLAFHLELCLRKWKNLGLEPRTLQFLICEAHERLKAGQPPTANSLPPAAESADVRSEHSIPSASTAKDAKGRPEPQNPGTPEPQTLTAKRAKDAK